MRPQPPRTDAEWARNTEGRLRRLESSSTAVRIGQWTLADRDGELVAVAADGRAYILSDSSLSATPLVTGTTAEAAPSYTRVVTITLTGWIVSGTFTLTFEGLTTDPIDYTATAADIKAALGALPNYAEGDFIVSGADGGPWTVAIPGVSITGDNSGMTYVPLFDGDVVIS